MKQGGRSVGRSDGRSVGRTESDGRTVGGRSFHGLASSLLWMHVRPCERELRNRKMVV